MKTIVFDFYQTLYDPKLDSLYRGSISVLKKLKSKYKLILISTRSPDRQNQISKLEIESYFEKIILCPSKKLAIFKQIIKNPANTIIIGDNPQEEIQIGILLKCQTLKVNPNSENPAVTIRKFLKL